jgi:flagellar hook-associated protein 1
VGVFVSLFEALNVGLTGLNVASAGLQVAEHNVANVSTPGFTRRTAVTGTADPVRRGLNWIGQGVSLTRIARNQDPFVHRRLLVATSEMAAANARQSVFQGVEGLFESDATSIRGDLDALFDAFGAATGDPSSQTLRRDVVVAADALAGSITRASAGLRTAVDDIDGTIAARLEEVNADLRLVADLNARVANGGGSVSAGDLADRRDQALARLAENIGAVAFHERDGSVTVRVGGHAAVSAAAARTLSYDASRGALTMSVDNGAVSITAEVGGTVRGQLAARETIAGWMADIGTLATDLVGALNAQNAAGFTSTGAAGGDLFVLTGTAATGLTLTVADDVTADPGLLAFAGAPSAEAGDAANLSAFLALETQSVVGGARTGAAALSDLTSRVGSAASLAATAADVATATHADAETLYISLSGVDLDEEAVRLVQYQAAYQAAAKVIQITDQTLDTLMSIVR